MTTQPILTTEAPRQSPPNQPILHLPRFGKIVLLTLTGIIGGALAWGAIREYGQSFPLAAEVRPLLDKSSRTAEEDFQLERAEMEKLYKNSALSLALFGAIVASLIGAVVGSTHGGLLRILTGGVAGAVMGMGLGAIAGLVETLIFDRLRRSGLDITYVAIMMHAIAFLIVGAGVGLAAALVVKERSVVFTAAAAGLIAGAIYPMISAAAFPVSNPDVPLPMDSGPLMLWTILPAGLMGLATGRASKIKRPLPQ